ncbi:MAG: hypothetical protein KAH31_06910 [Candidatus Sabulitectum sp.]|nr:hypothetical protein [Candidatus Sabulitectum sp.]
MRKMLVAVLSVFVALLASGCMYDPAPVGCSFQLGSMSPFFVAGVRLNNYSLDSLEAEDDSTIIASIESGDCPVSFVLNTSIRNAGGQGTILIEKFDWTVRIAAGGKQYVVSSGEIDGRIGVEASQTGIVCLLVSFNAAELWGEDFSTPEIRAICLDLGFKDNGHIREDQHLGRAQIEVDITEETQHGSINAYSVLIGLDWVQP